MKYKSNTSKGKTSFIITSLFYSTVEKPVIRFSLHLMYNNSYGTTQRIKKNVHIP